MFLAMLAAAWMAADPTLGPTPGPTPAAPGPVAIAPAEGTCAPDAGEAPLVPCLAPSGREVRHAPIVFDFDKGTIRPESLATLAALAVFLKAHPELTTLEVQAHRTWTGEEVYQDITRRRAPAVREALMAQGVAAERLIAVPAGDRYPLARRSESDTRSRRIVVAVRAVDGVPLAPRLEAPTEVACRPEFDAFRPPAAPCVRWDLSAIEMPPVAWEAGRAVLKREGQAALAKLAALLVQVPALTLIELRLHTLPEAHTRARGLSAERADAARAALVAAGIAPARVVAKGFGAEVPLVDPKGRERRRNERVEVRVMEWQGRPLE